MVFLNKAFLYAVPLIAALAAMLVWLFWKNYHAVRSGYGDGTLLGRLTQPLSRLRLSLFGALSVCGLTMLVVAAGRPAIRSDSIEFPQGTVDVVAVADVSRSMAAQDYLGKTRGDKLKGGTRLDMVRHILIHQLIPSLRSNRLGIVSFAGSAFDQAYLTDDYRALSWVVEEGMTITSAPGEGSNVAEALVLACRYFDVDSPSNHQRVVVLFSDGGTDDKEEDLDRAIAECLRRKIRVLVVGLGKPQPSAIPVAQLSPNDRYKMGGETILRINGETVMTAREERFLGALANRLNGRYIRLDNPGDFEMLPLDFQLESNTRTAYRELYRYPLILGLVALALAFAVVRSPRNPLRRQSSR